jgi:hypothetical protein
VIYSLEDGKRIQESAKYDPAGHVAFGLAALVTGRPDLRATALVSLSGPDRPELVRRVLAVAEAADAIAARSSRSNEADRAELARALDAATQAPDDVLDAAVLSLRPNPGTGPLDGAMPSATEEKLPLGKLPPRCLIAVVANTSRYLLGTAATPELQTRLAASGTRLVRADPGFALLGFEALARYISILPLPAASALEAAGKAIDELARSARSGAWTAPEMTSSRILGVDPDTLELRIERVRRDVAWAHVCALPAADPRSPEVARGLESARRCVQLSSDGPPRSRSVDRVELLRFLLEADQVDEAARLEDPGDVDEFAVAITSRALRAEVLRRRGDATGALALYGAHGYRRFDDEAELALIHADLGQLEEARASIERHRDVDSVWVNLTCLRLERVREYVEAKGKPK